MFSLILFYLTLLLFLVLLAVAKAQYAVADIATMLIGQGISVSTYVTQLIYHTL